MSEVTDAIDRIIGLVNEQRDHSDRMCDIAIGLIKALNDLSQALPEEVVLIPQVEAALLNASNIITLSRQVLALAQTDE